MALACRLPTLNSTYETLLFDVASRKNVTEALQLLDEMYNSVPNTTWDAAAVNYATRHATIHGTSIDDDLFTMRWALKLLHLVNC
jgi:hypothetical protein